MKLNEQSLMPPQASLWQASAGNTRDYPPPVDVPTVDVAVIGAGYCGLSAAIALRDAGASVAVVDAGQPGNGGSGRNGGQVWPGLKMLPAAMRRRFGDEAGERMARLTARSADSVFDLVERFGIDCDAQRAGVIRAAHSVSALQAMAREAEQWSAAGDEIELLDAAGLQRAVGSPRYVGGLWHKRGGAVHPLRYAAGLAEAAQRQGAHIHGDALVTGMRREGPRWTLHFERTPGRPQIQADQVLIATDAYTPDGLLPGLAQSLIPLFSFQVATRPLSDSEWAGVCPGGQPVSDSQRLLRYFRRGPGQRLLMGGRAPFKEQPQLADAPRLRAYLREVFPALAGIELDYCWGGRVGMTTDHIPRLTQPAPGVVAALGYNGFGVAMATLMGQQAAGLMRREAPADALRCSYPLTALAPIPMHELHLLPVRALIALYTLQETLSL
jgi:glycine/D-amino acid oxidase-like deaminating enzyme